MIAPIKKGSDVRTDWLTTNRLVAAQADFERRIYLLEHPNDRRFQAGGGGKLETYRVKSASADYLVCRTWDGTTEGTEDIKVAKNFESRQPASEILAGTTYYYAYVAGPDGDNDYRNVTGGATIQQIVVPLWVVDGLILVARTNCSGVDDGSGNDLKLIEVSARCWAGPTSV